MLPPARTLKRLAAPLLVFILGITTPLSYGGRCFPMEKLDYLYTTYYWDYLLHQPGRPLLPNQSPLKFSSAVFIQLCFLSGFYPASEITPSPSACLPSWGIAQPPHVLPSPLLRARSS